VTGARVWFWSSLVISSTGCSGRGGGPGEVEGGGLEAVEEEARAFAVENAVGDALEDEADGGAVLGQLMSDSCNT
jgi:hypothetical protein